MPARSVCARRNDLNPSMDRIRRLIFSHHFLQITQAKVIGQIPAHTLGDDIDGIIQSLEGISDKRHGQVTSLKKKHII